MSALLVFILSAAACGLVGLGGSVWRATRRGGGGKELSAAGRTGPNTAESLPRLVRQLASLLAAGRSGPLVWGALAQVLAMEQARRPAGRPVPVRSRAAANGDRMPADAVLVLVLAVQRATGLGMPTATAVRTSCGEAAAPARKLRIRRHGPALTAEQHRVWLDVAACFEVCEGSGAPVAAILDRLALAIEAEQDTAALRATALAGPRATVRLLSWLPFIGLGLGVAMGVDPIGALLGSPLGWAVLATGVAFSLAGRIWSARMIGGAARPPELPQRRSAGAGSWMRSFTLHRRW
ncbi:hypothetical protein [Arthrobacter sp. H35-D1]|uniref:type II secretion system F family protein n=1 Tax=Arthrobacter sp. H35-D1 TaxID=3046202 RepID=UPI0024BAB0A9|nr:hypothetical protein [Arthrobacter sp. H35-D1]MDJ0311835.1 hypothetical protein [Arthrobacter sp. H35-D1]